MKGLGAGEGDQQHILLHSVPGLYEVLTEVVHEAVEEPFLLSLVALPPLASVGAAKPHGAHRQLRRRACARLPSWLPFPRRGAATCGYLLFNCTSHFGTQDHRDLSAV